MNKSEYVSIFKALADETRMEIFEMLSGGELCACKILENFDITQPTLSYHMKALCDSGLVEGRRDGAWIRYTINKKKFDAVKNYLNDIKLDGINENSKCDKNC